MQSAITINRSIYLLFVIALSLAIYSISDQIHDLKFPTDLNYKYLFIAILGQILFWVTSCFTWRQSLNIFTGHRLSFVLSFIHSNIVTIGKYLPGKIWGLVSRGIDLKQRGINNKETFLVSYLDQALLLHAGIAIGSFSLALSKSLALAVIIFILCVLSVLLVSKGHDILTKVTIKFTNNFDLTKLKSNLTTRNYSILMIYYMAAWLVSGLMFASIYFAFFGFDSRLLLPLIGASSIGIIAGFIAVFAPGGLGVREAASAGILIEFIPAEEAIFLVLICRLWTVLTDITGGILAFGLHHTHKEKFLADNPRN